MSTRLLSPNSIYITRQMIYHAMLTPHYPAGVLVACLGHYSPRPRALAVRLLNALYDGVDWQVAAPLAPVMAQVGERATLDLYTAHPLGAGGDRGEAFRILVSAPSFDLSFAGLGGDHLLTMHAPIVTMEEVWTRAPASSSSSASASTAAAGGGSGEAAAAPATGAVQAAGSSGSSSLEDSATAAVDAPDGSCRYIKLRAYRVRLSLAPFPRCGYFDWRLVAVPSTSGLPRPVAQLNPILGHELAQLVAQGIIPTEAGALSPVGVPAMLQQPAPGAVRGSVVLPSDSGAAAAGLPLALAQGRFIVHRAGLREEHMHEVVVDLEGMKFSEGGEIVRHGTFADVAGNLRGLRGNGVTSLFVLGAIERDNGWGEREADPSDLAFQAAQEQSTVVAGNGGDVSKSGAPPGTTPGGHVPANEYTHTPTRPLQRGTSVSAESVAESDFGFFSLDTPGESGGGGVHGGAGTGTGAGGPAGASSQLVTLLTPFDTTGMVGVSQQQQAMTSGGEASDITPGVRAYAARPDANPHAVVDRLSPNRMLGGQLGFARLCQDARSLGMRVLVQLDAAISASRPHRKYKQLYARTLDTKGQAVIHHGSDALENQWEDTQLLNYRKVEAWDLMVSEAKTLVQNFGVGGLYLTDAQSYPFIMASDTSELFRRDVDGEGHYSPREILEGEVVIANTEIGYWTTKAARAYANPLLVKLTRALWAISPDFTIVGECHWGRAGALQRSGVVPRSLDIVSAMASTIGRYVDKNGTIVPFSLPSNVQPVHYLRALLAGEAGGIVPPQAAPQFLQSYLHANGSFPPPLTSLLEGPGGPMPRGGTSLQLRSLASARLPYPALLLGRSAWTGVDLLYSLPGLPCTFGEEKAGRAYRVDVTGTYTYNPAYLEEEKKKREKRLAAEKHVQKARHARTSSTSGPSGLLSARGNGFGSSNQLSDLLQAGAAPAGGSSTGGSTSTGGATGSGINPATGTPFSTTGGGQAPGFDFLTIAEGDIGVGGVVPAMPVRGAPSYKIARTGFSHLNLASLAVGSDDSSSRSGPLFQLQQQQQQSGGLSGRPGVPPLAPPFGSPHQQQPSTSPPSSRGGGAVPQFSYSSPTAAAGSSGGGGGGGMTRTFGSSPALQSLLLMSGSELPHVMEGGAGGAAGVTPRGAGGDTARSGVSEPVGSPPEEEGEDGEDEEEEDEDEAAAAAAGLAALSVLEGDRSGAAGGATGAGGVSGFGFHVPAFLSGAGSGGVTSPGLPSGGKPPRGSRSSKLRESWSAEEGGSGAAGMMQPPLGSGPTTVTAPDGSSLASLTTGGSFKVRSPTKHQGGSGAPGSGGGSSDITRVTSWAALDTMTFKGGDGLGLGAGGASLRDSLKQLAAMEARLRSEVGPQYGFDLAMIGGHYDHRRLLRARYPVLRDGGLVTLTAHHRFGEHGHVFAFARTLPGQLAVVASNFNGHPSTFTVDCSPLVSALGASTTADASASVAQLMSASIAAGEAVKARLTSSSAPSASMTSSDAGRPVSILPPGGTGAIPSLNLKGGVWEVRDVFSSDGRRTASAGIFEGPASFSEADGPLIGIMTSEEAAYAPMLTTLQPHRSYCWLYVAASGSTGSAAGRTPIHRGGGAMGSPLFGPTGASSSSLLDRDLETDPAAMQWLFASSLLRLQSVMRLKECGLASAIITRAEVEAAGGIDKLLSGRKLGQGEAWISPGEALKDTEIQSAARQNLVYSLLRHVVKRCYKAVTKARQEVVTASASAAATPGAAVDLAWSVLANPDTARSAPQPTRQAISDVIAETAVYLEAALRVLVTHWRLRPTPAQPGRNEPPPLVADPLPSLHGAMNRGDDAFASGGGTGSASSGGDGGGSSGGGGHEAAWYCIDCEAAVVIARTALFLAVKDVVQQASGRAAAAAKGQAQPSSSSSQALPTDGPAPTDVTDEDGTISALLIKALVRIARGRTAAGAALGAQSSSSPGPFSGHVATEQAIVAFAHRLLWRNNAAPIVFVTPELGKWSTVGGLGVMVDELSIGLAELGLDVVCISPYYHLNRKGATDYLRGDGITYTGRNIAVYAGSERIEMGVHEGKVKGVRLFFLHNGEVFPRPYPPHDAFHQVRVMSAFGKGCLELLCQWRLIPNVVITNDWFTGLVPAYARHGHFGDAFQRTDFMHIAHNLDPDYEGRLWPAASQGTLGHVHGLPSYLLVDPHWHDVVINPTRAALMCSDTWATVSRSYRQDLLSSSPLRSLLQLAPHPFAHPNGIPVKARLARLASLATPTHAEAKAALQRKYFGFETGDPSIPLFAFVGRITLQKGVHLILQAVEELLRVTGGRAMFLVGGMASQSDTYGIGCSHVMRDLAARHPSRFWANPDLFFTDGDVVNLGADFCMMPSMFEPGGIVQQEFFVAGTPVIAFKTGGLKDTVHEWDAAKRSGNGITFEAHNVGDFSAAVHRALAVYSRPEDYATLRANARASVMDLAVVSLGWAREFFRLRRCLPPAPAPPPPEMVLFFSINVGEVPGLSGDSVVELTGSWASWARKYPMALSADGKRFETTLALPPGTFQFKFVVDGVWTTAPSLPAVDDGTGNVNNVITSLAPHQDDED